MSPSNIDRTLLLIAFTDFMHMFCNPNECDSIHQYFNLIDKNDCISSVNQNKAF